MADMTIAAGWPYSANAKKKDDAVAEYIEESEADRAWRREMRNYAFAKRDREYRMALERAQQAQTDANREHWKILRRAYQREQEVFAERAQGAAKVLETFVGVGGQLDAGPRPDDPCPCQNGLPFALCHGFVRPGGDE